MFLHVLTNSRQVNLQRHIDLLKHVLAANTRQLKDVGRLQCTSWKTIKRALRLINWGYLPCGQADVLLSIDCVYLAVVLELDAYGTELAVGRWLSVQTMRRCVEQNREIRSIFVREVESLQRSSTKALSFVLSITRTVVAYERVCVFVS